MRSLLPLVDLLLDVGVELVPTDALGVEAGHVIDDLSDVLVGEVELQLVADALQIVELQHFLTLRVDQREDCPAAGLVVGVTLNYHLWLP